MALLNDIREIIKPINIISNDNFYKNMESILENLIVHNNTSYNSFIFNHIIYNKSNDDNKIVIEYIVRHLNSYIKNQRIHFRNLNKKYKLSVSDFNLFFDNVYKLVSKLNSMFQHIIINKKNDYNANTTHKWGTSILWECSINSINNILISDTIFKYSINNNINSKDIYRLNYYINIFSDYIDPSEKNIFYSDFINHIDNALVDNIEAKKSMFISSIKLENNNVDENIINVNVFNMLYKYYMDCYSNYYYISKNYSFNKLKQCVIDHIIKIFETDDYTFIKNFMTTYKKEFNNLTKHIDIACILLNCSPTDIHNYIEYNNVLYEIAQKNSNLLSIVINCIKNKIDIFFNSFENTLYLADLINTNIINKTSNHFYYLIGIMIKNKDEFINAICQKLMERIIYTDIDFNIESQNMEILNSINTYNIHSFLKYETILKDYVTSREYYVNDIKYKFKLLITSLDAWKINHSNGYSNTIINYEEFTTILCNNIYKYNQANEYLNIKKKLIFYPHLGSVEIEIYNRKITILPAHMFCLELFVSPKIKISSDDIFNKVKMNMSNYTDDFIKNIINSLVGPILIKSDDHNQYQINPDLTNSIEPINMINIFHKNNNTNKIIIKKMKEELCYEREHIIMANINHFIKKFEQVDTTDLHDMLEENIKLFKVDEKQYVEVLFKMSEKRYLDINNTKVRKVLYK